MDYVPVYRHLPYMSPALLPPPARYATKQGWKAAMVSCTTAEAGGYKEIILQILGEGVYRCVRAGGRVG